MDAVGAGREEKGWEKPSSTAVITTSSLMLLDSHFAPPAEVQRWYMKYSIFFTPSAVPAGKGTPVMTYVGTAQPALQGGT